MNMNIIAKDRVTTQDDDPCSGLHGVSPDVKCAVYLIPVQHMGCSKQQSASALASMQSSEQAVISTESHSSIDYLQVASATLSLSAVYLIPLI
jgi:hypothetical protein